MRWLWHIFWHGEDMGVNIVSPRCLYCIRKGWV